ncbi:ABC transporter permease [Streptococcus fryi]
MFKRISALVWLRSQILMSNKNLLAQMLLPYMLVFIYKNFMGTETNGLEIMFVCLSTAISMSVGSMISTIIAEEKEKNNLQTLMLSGVRPYEYIISVLIHPLIVALFTMTVFPIITEVDLEGKYFEYSIILLLTSLAVMLLNLCIGLISDTQAKAQINSLPILFVVSLLPMFSGLKESVKNVVDWTFMAAYTDFFTQQNFQLENKSLKILVLWNIVLLVITFVALKKSKIVTSTGKK